MRQFALLGALLFAALPATTNYELNSYGFGSGGTANSHTTTYSLEGASGELNGGATATANATTKPGFVQTEQANVPKLSALDNGSGVYYNKLHFVIDTQNNPTDATYLLSVSTDNFVSNTTYLQSDGTLSATLNVSDYQTYAAWGGSGGGFIIGLNPSTTYYVKLRATQGKFTESAYGPVSSQATAGPSITFNLVTSTQPTPPFSLSLGTLIAGVVNTSSSTVNTTMTTNGASGGNVYIASVNGGLLSSSTGYRINAVSTDLSTSSEGFGVQNSTVTQGSGGPYSVVSPYNGSSNNVGLVNSIGQSLYTSTAPVTSGAGTLVVKAKSASTDTAASDYQEVLIFTAAGNF